MTLKRKFFLSVKEQGIWAAVLANHNFKLANHERIFTATMLKRAAKKDFGNGSNSRGSFRAHWAALKGYED